MKASIAMTGQKILDFSYSQLKEWVCAMGEPGYRADQILRWVYGRLATSFEQMTDLPQPLRQKLASVASLFSLIPVGEKVSADGSTRKVLFRTHDEKTIESVLMLYPKTGLSRERRTICVSTQVGCPVGCPFCATGQQGFERNLDTGEIIEQILYFMRLLNTRQLSQEILPNLVRRPVTNVVFMGMGEPLANYEAVWQSIVMLNSNHGLEIGARQITVSTAGLVLQIKRLARESVHVELAVSLHAARDNLRDTLVPINRKYPLGQLIPECWEYLEKTGRRPTFEYALFQGINDSLSHARDLSLLLKRLNCHVNLMVGNPTTNPNFIPPPIKRVVAFQNYLTESGVSNSLRASKGVDIDAACGQLRSRWLNMEPKTQGAQA